MRTLAAAFPVLPRGPGIEHGKLDVLEGARPGEKVEALEDEADLLGADGGQLIAGKAGDFLAGEAVGPGGRRGRGSRADA